MPVIAKKILILQSEIGKGQIRVRMNAIAACGLTKTWKLRALYVQLCLAAGSKSNTGSKSKADAACAMTRHR